MANEQARPKAQPPAPKKPTSTETAAAIRSAALVRTEKEQDEFEAPAAAIAASLGWDGEPDWVLGGIQVSDARRYLAKILHEVHVAALNKSHKRPSADDVCAHLGIAPGTPEIVHALDKAWEQESGKPTSPTS